MCEVQLTTNPHTCREREPSKVELVTSPYLIAYSLMISRQPCIARWRRACHAHAEARGDESQRRHRAPRLRRELRSSRAMPCAPLTSLAACLTILT